MADQTHGAVDTLVGLLSTAIKDEARLLGGVQGDMQFIKDEMDSMNGFLLHLTKTEVEHDDQLRAWMKQVRDIAYIAQDFIELYVRDFTPPDRGLWGLLSHLPVLLWTMPARHRLATKIRELKVRVRDVGERRLRYDVTVPRAAELKQTQLAAGQDSGKTDVDRDRDDFLRALARDKEQQNVPSFSHAIDLLPEFASEARKICDKLKSCVPGDHATRTIHMEMLLRALHAHQDRRTKQDLGKLLEAADHTADLPKKVMVFCYSRLSTLYKSCLQYLSTFSKETSISRTSLVRRWLAEGLVDREGSDDGTLEKAAEHCFSELLFRGFLLPDDTGAAGKVKSCKVDEPVRRFVLDITKSENFVSHIHLPFHHDNQVRIRDLVRLQQERPQNRREEDSSDGPRQSICGFSAPTKPPDDIAAAGGKDPMDQMVDILKSLPLSYRLNVLDLGGCRGLKQRHLRCICKVRWLKYLSLRKTDVCRLPKQINKLKFLETLDIRQTHVRSDTKHISLPKLKHLLADPASDAGESSRMPRRIGTMRDMEILSHVQVSSHGGDVVLEEVGRLQHLRKLGVVLDGSEANIKHLLRAIGELNKSLRSLSIRMRSAPTTNGEGVDMKLEKSQPRPELLESLNISGLGNARLPTWILELTQLSKITLCETSLSTASLQNLGNLPGLLCLRLRRNSYNESKLAFTKDGFKALKFLEIEGEKIASVAFEEDGTTPALEKIVWRSSAVTDITSDDTLYGIHYLPRLEVVELKKNGRSQRLIIPWTPSGSRIDTIIVEGPE